LRANLNTPVSTLCDLVYNNAGVAGTKSPYQSFNHELE
jgi:hypothetical protein